MTTLNRKIQRQTAAAYRGRNIIIQLEPPSIIRVKEKGRRTWYETTVEAVFSMAGKAHADRIRKERKDRKNTLKINRRTNQ